ncbi:MAG: M20 family metallo-hydrolase [Deltaproteobacteria bacterium]
MSSSKPLHETVRTARPLSIRKERLWDSLQALGRIGEYHDEASGLLGVNRLALTAADGEGRRHVVQRMKALGLSVTIDRIGNVYGRREGLAAARPVLMGSHIDSVSTAGRFDGCLGVLGALEILETLAEARITTRRPLVAAFFTDEEGSRFGTDMLGSAVATGRVPLETAYALRDRDGLGLRDELSKLGFLGEAPEALAPPHAYLECHIEQGPTLRASGKEIGVVTGVQAISWHELTIVGKSAHAGTTPMELRADAGVAAARVNVKLREMIASGRYGPSMRATMGASIVRPGLVNIVPGRVVATVDLRNPDDALMRRAEADLIAFYEQVAREERVALSWRQTARTDSVPFAAEVQARVAAAASARGLSQVAIVSGAGHDAQELARICRAGMVFVPGEHDGISHNPREYSTPEQCANGIDVLLDVVRSFAEEAGP